MACSKKLAIIAGGGPLPLSVACHAQASGRDVFIITLDGFTNCDFSTFDHRGFRITQANAIFNTIKKENCKEVVLIGTVHRPKRWRMDVGISLFFLTLKNLNFMWDIAALAYRPNTGDATLLSKIIQGFELQGLKVLGAHEVAPHLNLPVGTITRSKPSSRDHDDIVIGLRAVRTLGELDIGQCVVVVGGRVIAVEAAEGTDQMLKRSMSLNSSSSNKLQGILIKWPQPIQDLRIDMPTIGLRTIINVHEAGLAGVVYAGENVLGVDICKMTEFANRHGLFITGLKCSTPC